MGSKLGILTETFSPGENHSWLGSSHGVDDADTVTIDGDTFLTTFTDGIVPSGVWLAKRTSDGLYIPYVGTAEKQRITVDATGGTYTISFDGETTAAIAATAIASAVQTALENLSNVNVGDVVVTGGPGNAGGTTPYFVEFVAGDYAGVDNAPSMTTTTSLTGGAGTAVVATPTAAPTDGSQIAKGVLLTTTQLGPRLVPTPTAAQVGNVPVPLMWHGEVITSKLPANSGWDSRVALDLPMFRFV